jgi:uncharacterized membrane protein (DUF2068 family)
MTQTPPSPPRPTAVAASPRSVAPAKPALPRFAGHLPPWRRRQVLYLRALAVVLLVSGLWQWSWALGMIEPGGRAFLELRGAARNALGAFAVLDLVAAVGLWLAAAWGPVLFACDVLASAALHTFSPDTHGSAPVSTTLWMLLLAVTVVLALLRIREARNVDAERRRQRKEERRRPPAA